MHPRVTQFVFNLTNVEAFAKGRGFKASSGITGPVRDSIFKVNDGDGLRGENG
jgi:hypothetical protein